MTLRGIYTGCSARALFGTAWSSCQTPRFATSGAFFGFPKHLNGQYTHVNVNVVVMVDLCSAIARGREY